VKLMVTPLVKNYPIFAGTQRFISVFTTGHDWSKHPAPDISSSLPPPFLFFYKLF